jgi:hypothetical protein
MSELPSGLPQGLPRVPDSPAPPIPQEEASRPPVGQMGRRLVSSSGPAVTRQDAEAAKRTFNTTLDRISASLQEIEESPIWQGARDSGGGDLEEIEGRDSEKVEEKHLKAIRKRRSDISRLEGELTQAKTELGKSGAVLKRGYKQLSQQILKMEARLAALKSALEVYENIENPVVAKAVQTAQKVQERCQRLNWLSRKGSDFSIPQTTEEYGNAVKELQRLTNEVVSARARLENEGGEGQDAAVKVYNEALELLQGTLDRVVARVDEKSPSVFSRKKDDFNENKRDVSTLLNALLLQVDQALPKQPTTAPTPKVLRLTLLGRKIHREEVQSLEKSLKDLETNITSLLDKVARGTANEADRQEIESLKARLEAARGRYNELSLTIGREASSTQFISRAVCLASIEASARRIEALDAVLNSEAIGDISARSTMVLEKLSTALRSEGQSRAEAFYEACETLEALEDQVDRLIPAPEAEVEDPRSQVLMDNSLAKSLLEQKVVQLRLQLQSAAETVFAVQSDREKDEQQCAVQMGSRVPLTGSQKQKVIPFLINAMTMLSVPMFEMRPEEANALRATVDLCLHELPDELREELPRSLLDRYRETSGPEVGELSWSQQMGQVRALIQKFDGVLGNTKKELSLLGNYKTPADQLKVLEAIDQLTVYEQELESLEDSLDPALFKASREAFERMKADVPIEFTREEKSLIKSLPKSPTFEEKRTIRSALAKLMFQARHHPDAAVRAEMMAQAQAVIEAMGFNIEYRSVFVELSSQKVMLDFQKNIPALSLPFLSLPPPKPDERERDARKQVDAIFQRGSVWAQTLLTADILPIELNDEEKTKINEYIRLRQDVALLQAAAPSISKKEPSWQQAARLEMAYARVCGNEKESAALMEKYPELKKSLEDYARRSHITDDKRGIADEIIYERPEARSYFTARIKDYADEGKKLERVQAVLVPLLLAAYTSPDGLNTVYKQTKKGTTTIGEALKPLLEEFCQIPGAADNLELRELLLTLFLQSPTVQEQKRKLEDLAQQMEKSVTKPQEFFRLSAEYAKALKRLETLAEDMVGTGTSVNYSHTATRLRDGVASTADQIKQASDVRLKDSPLVRSCVTEGRKYLQDQIRKLNAMPLDEKSKYLNSPEFRDGLLGIFKGKLGDSAPKMLLSDLMNQVFEVEDRNSRLKQEYDSLFKGFNPEGFARYKQHTEEHALLLLLRHSGAAKVSSTDDFDADRGLAFFKPRDQAENTRGISQEFASALQSFEEEGEMHQLRSLFAELVIRPASLNAPPEVTAQNMRQQFEGMVKVIYTRLENIAQMKRDLENPQKDYSISPEERRAAIEHLAIMQKKLEEYRAKIYQRMSPETVDAANKLSPSGTSEAVLVAAMRKDTKLTPENISALMCDPALNDCLGLSAELEGIVKGDPLFLDNVQKLSNGLIGSNGLITGEILKECLNRDLRGQMLQQKRVVDATGWRVGVAKTTLVPTPEDLSVISQEKKLSRRSLNIIYLVSKDKTSPLRDNLCEIVKKRQETATGEEKTFLDQIMRDL